jgi:adenylyltransferase/sulfurtransferase
MTDLFHARHEALFDVSRIDRVRVLVIGAGSLGSAISALLVRSGVRFLRLVDKDVVEEVNLCRTTYLARDLGAPKVDALARHLREIRPCVEVEALNADLRAQDDDKLRAWIADSDLVLALTDSPSVQARIGALSYHTAPAVFAGVYERGIGGEVLFTLPVESSSMLQPLPSMCWRFEATRR